MLNEFYNYIASNTLSFFQEKEKVLQRGERYCLKLDTEEMVEGVDSALKAVSSKLGIQGSYSYTDSFTGRKVYDTFTLKISDKMEIVVASKINGMTDDFLATLRNAELTDYRFPILMITHSAIDTITSGTGDLSAKGMPFHSQTIINKIKEDISQAELSVADRVLLEEELKRKQGDRYSDKSSLYEYSDLLTVLGRGAVQDSDFALFSLLSDPDMSPMQDPDKICARINENHKIFEKIDRVYKHGNISDALSGEFDRDLVGHINDTKKCGTPLHENITYSMVVSTRDKQKRKLDNPLEILDEGISAYSSTPIEYSFHTDELLFVRCEGKTKAKQRKKSVLIFNPDNKDTVVLAIEANVRLSMQSTEFAGAKMEVHGKKAHITVKATGVAFAYVKIEDPQKQNKISYELRICVLNILPAYLRNIQTAYLIGLSKKAKNGKLQIYGMKKEFVINPGCENVSQADLEADCKYECFYNQTLRIAIGEETIDTDLGYLDCILKVGSVELPLQIRDEFVKPTELTGSAAFKLKHTIGKSLEYRDGNKIVVGTDEYFARDPFKTSLETEAVFIKNKWAAAVKTIDGYKEWNLNIDASLKSAYEALIDHYSKQRTIPSLGYFKVGSDLHEAAVAYIDAVEEAFSKVIPGKSLNAHDNDALFLGCMIDQTDEATLAMTPLHPLNVLYQLNLMNEAAVGSVRENLVEKLSALYLLPYIRSNDKGLYYAVEQKHSPEWRFYAPISNKRYQGARNFVQKLVCDKINQYKGHFSFLFDDIENRKLCLNLVNMGDCREIFQGLIRYYVTSLRDDKIDQDDMLHFDVSIYAEKHQANDFMLLGDMAKLKQSIRDIYTEKEVGDVGELALILTSNIRCFYKKISEEQYQYAHLTFYEMASAENTGASRMDSITTGISLGGIVSGTPSVLDSSWYKTGFGTKYAVESRLTQMASCYNAMFRVAFSGSSYEPVACIFTESAQGLEVLLGKIYDSSNWVVFIAPKVDLSFFQKGSEENDELMIIHYSDQYSSASGYDDITVTHKSSQYNEIITDQLQKKGVTTDISNINGIISLFNAINGGWMLRLITAKKLSGAADSNFSREKMSILSAIKLCMAYYNHPEIVWIPLSLEEMLRVSGGAGLSQKDGLLSAKNLGFEQRATSDDILLVGVEGPSNNIKIYLHPVEVKIGQNPAHVLSKATEQVKNTYKGLWDALWPEMGKNDLERKLSRNFFMQLLLVCCEKLRLYEIYPDEEWDAVLCDYRENLLNENYIFSNAMDQYIGKGTVVSFGTDVLNKSGTIGEDQVCLLEIPEKLGSSYMVISASEIERELDLARDELPRRLKYEYRGVIEDDIPDAAIVEENTIPQDSVSSSKPADSECGVVEDIPIDESESGAEDILLAEESATVSTPGMQILFGRDVASGESLYWCPNDTEQIFHTNTGIIGTMGTGKTQFTKSMITQLYRDRDHNIGGNDIGILIFDYKGDYNESKEDFVIATDATILKPYHLPFNPLSLTQSKVFKPLLPTHTANAFKDTLSKVYGLGPKQQNTLFQCIMDAYAARGIRSGDKNTWDRTPPTFDMVYSLYANNDDIKKNDSLAAAMDKLHQFEVFEGNPQNTKSLFDLLHGVVVVDLSGYDADIQSLIVAITLDLFYAQMQAAGSSKLDNQYRQATKLILVDEADNFMSEGFPALKKILKEGREFGVGTILSTQFLKHFGSGEDDYSKYILTWVVHNVADLISADVEFVFHVEGKSAESQVLYNDIKSLKKHHSIVKVGNAKPQYIVDKAFWELYKEISQ